MRRKTGILVSTAVFFLVIPASRVDAQIVISGTVISDSAAVSNALVQILAVSRSRTNAQGQYKVNTATAGRYVLRITAFGFFPHEREILVLRDTTINVTLDLNPIVLNPLEIRGQTYQLQGFLLEAGTGYPIAEGDAFLQFGEHVRSGVTGKFTFKSITPGTQAALRVEAFGYEPETRIVAINTDTTLVIELKVDRLSQRIIASKITQLRQRSTSTGYSLIEINAADLRASNAQNAGQLVKRRLGNRAGPISCVFIDERQGLAEELDAYPVDQIVRVEVIDRGKMVRLYTMSYIRKMIEGRVIPGPITIVGGTTRPICV